MSETTYDLDHAEAVLEFIKEKYGKPFYINHAGKLAVAKFLDGEGDAVLGNWFHAARIIEQTSELIRASQLAMYQGVELPAEFGRSHIDFDLDRNGKVVGLLIWKEDHHIETDPKIIEKAREFAKNYIQGCTMHLDALIAEARKGV